MSERAKPGRYAFAALIALGILNHMVLSGSRVTVSLYALAQGATPLIVGVLSGLYAFLPMLLAVSAGRLSDRIGVRRPMLLGSAGLALGAAVAWALPGLGPLYFTTSLLGVSFMLFQVAAQNATGDFGEPSERARNFSMLALGYSTSGFCGPLLAGFLIDHTSFGTTFGLLALLPLVPVAVLSRGSPALPAHHAEHAQAARGSVTDLLRQAE